MTAQTRLLIFTSIIALSSTQAAIAAEAAPSDPFVGETPLTKAELSEARGGFSMGGFHFDFGITVHPIDVQAAAAPHDANSTGQHGSMFGDDGMFGEDGLFSDDGVFGEGGVFGDKNNSDADQTSTIAPTTDSNGSPAAPVVADNTVTAPASANVQDSAASQPIQSPAEQNSSGSVTGGAVAPALSSAPEPQSTGTSTADPVSSQNQSSRGGISQSPGEENSSVAQDHDADLASPASSAQASSNDGSSPSQKSSSAAAPPKQPDATLQGYMVASGENTFIINNTQNNRVFQQRIDINVMVPNFREAVSMAATAQAASRIVSDPIILGALRMH